MCRSFSRFAIVAVLVPLTCLVLEASTPRFWKVSTQPDVLKGEVEHLSIDEFGRLILGPVTRSIYDATVPFIWCLAAAPDGTVYAGTGNDGQVVRVDRQGQTSIWFDAAELEVHALAVAPDGALYVGTSPDGRVYRVDAAGSSRVFFDPADKYIWSLVFDGQGRLHVGTGEKGIIYRVTPDGRGETVFTSTSTHVTSMAFDGQGRLLAGTDSPGRLVRIDASGKAFVLLDSPYRELRAVRVDAAGRIYAAAVDGKPAADTPQQTPGSPETPRMGGVPSVSTEITAIAIIDAPTIGSGSQAPVRRDSAAKPKGAVYRIETDGQSETIWESQDDIPFDVMLDDADGVMVSTGNGGKIYRVSGSPARAALVTRVSGKQATSMVTVGAARYVTTSNPGRIVSMSRTPATEGTYTSEVRDAGTVASWGTVSWRTTAGAGGQVEVFARSGNTATPDGTWSAWDGPYTTAEGDAIRCPAARYFQWKVVLRARTNEAPALASVSVAYLQRNQRPRVTDITVHPPGVVFQRPFPTGEPEIAGLDAARPEARFPVYSMPLGSVSTGGSTGPSLGRRLYQRALQAFVWSAADDNGDRLIYDVQFRRIDETAWKPIRMGTLDEVLVWDTTSVADGSYVLRVTASDRLSNPPSVALAGDAQSQAFEVDNTPPAVTVLQVKPDGARSSVVFEVRDSHSVIERVEYSVDAGAWQTAYPMDGAADATRERYEIVVEGQAAGRVVIRAADAMNNTGTARVETPPPSRDSRVR
jgi:hypothetical protein